MAARHQAPRRQVTSIERTAGYGATRYHHRLECGHTLIARRPNPNSTVGCVSCIETERLAALLEAPDPSPVDLSASLDIDAARLRAGLAKLLHCDLEDVRVESGFGPSGPRLVGATIWLSAATLESLRTKLL